MGSFRKEEKSECVVDNWVGLEREVKRRRMEGKAVKIPHVLSRVAFQWINLETLPCNSGN